MLRTLPLAFLAICMASSVAAPLVAQGQPAAAAAPVAPRSQGLKVTYAPLDADRKGREGVHSFRARVASLAVERGETPTPLLSPGMFQAKFEGVVQLALRDRYRFRVEGRGSFTLLVNGEKALHGALRAGKPVETAEPVRLKKGDNAIVLQFESGLGGDGEARLLWSGADFAFEPIAPEMWVWADDDAEIQKGELLRRGHQTFAEKRCVQCHRNEEAQGAYSRGDVEESAPDLRTAGARLQPGFVAEWIRDPKKVRADASMPRIVMEKESDYDDVAAWILSLSQPIEPVPFADGAAARGAERFLELGCVACHIAPGEKPDSALVLGRLSLDYVPRKWRALALQTFLMDPSRVHPGAKMPNFRLEADDAKALAAYLLKDATVTAPPKGNVEHGKHLAQRHACDRCHVLDVPDAGRRFRAVRTLHPVEGCLSEKRVDKTPDYQLTADERAALRAFLPHANDAIRHNAPMDYAARMVGELRCANCHGMDGRASAWAQIVSVMGRQDPLPHEQDPTAQGVPALTWVGSKLQPAWMDRFVTGREPSPRPWLHARMPSFGSRGSAVIQGLVRSHGYPAQDDPEPEVDTALAASGGKLVNMGEGFGCVQCHGVGDKPPVQVFERQGINFKVAQKRLRRDYYMRWMLDPLRIDPDSRMPKFADAKGKTAFADVLDGDAKRQFDAIWHWFRTL